jgi:hypothetical protein
MKRFAIVLALALPASIIVGCDGGGVEVGSPSEAPKGAQTQQFREAMEKAGNKMMKGQMKGQMKGSAGAKAKAEEQTKE